MGILNSVHDRLAHAGYIKYMEADRDIRVNMGWYALLEPLFQLIADKYPKVRVSCIKEKFGGLRFYISGHEYDDYKTDELYVAIHAAEADSYKTCEYCGKEGALRSGGWIKTLCDVCADGRERLKP